MNPNLSTSEQDLREALSKDSSNWEIRKELAHLLYDNGDFEEAASVVWEADEIPSVDLELAFAARVLAKAAPRKAIRLLTAVLEKNRGRAVQNLGLANALMHHGMVMQAARFYGAALEADPSLGNPDLEHFILWTDDNETLWGDFKDRKPELGALPWMKRDPKEAIELAKSISQHTSPVKVPGLKRSPGEYLKNEMYQQEAAKGAEPTPPPAVIIPSDRVDKKYRNIDKELGAASPADFAKKKAPAAPKPFMAPSNNGAGHDSQEEPSGPPKPAAPKLVLNSPQTAAPRMLVPGGNAAPEPEPPSKSQFLQPRPLTPPPPRKDED